MCLDECTLLNSDDSIVKPVDIKGLYIESQGVLASYSNSLAFLYLEV